MGGAACALDSTTPPPAWVTWQILAPPRLQLSNLAGEEAGLGGDQASLPLVPLGCRRALCGTDSDGGR